MQSRRNLIGNLPTGLAGGFRIAIACRIAVDNYQQQRTMRWDAVKEKVV